MSVVCKIRYCPVSKPIAIRGREEYERLLGDRTCYHSMC